MRRLTEDQWDLLRKAFEILFGVAVAGVVARIGKPRTIVEGIDCVSAGLLATLTSAVIIEFAHFKRAISDIRERTELALYAFANHTNRLNLALRYGNKRLSSHEMPKAWGSLLWEMTGSFDATSYVRPDHYSHSYPELGLAIQKAKIQVSKMQVRRIFILENDNELPQLIPYAIIQADIGIAVSYVLMDDIKAHPLVRQLETIDFGLFEMQNSELAFLWLLKGRAVDGGKIRLDPEIHAKYRTLFDDMCHISKPFSSIQLQPCR